VLESLVEDDLLSKNPAKAAIVTKPKIRKPSQRFLTLAECRALLCAATGRDYIILRIMLSCALRPSELFALRAQDVLPGYLRINEAAVPGMPVKGTTTEESDGTVPISAALEMEIRTYMRAAASMSPRDFLFPSEVGTAMNHENYLDRNLKLIAERAGISGVNHQVLRRTVATHMQNHGSVKSAQTIQTQQRR
jgi:integrase